MEKTHSKIKFGIILTALVMASAFGLLIVQNKIIKVSAMIEPIAFIGPNSDFGIVFSGELLNKDFFVRAVEEYDASISYSLLMQVKPRQPADGEYCLANPLDYAKCYPLLCDYLDILSADNEGDTKNSASLYPPSDVLDSWKVILNTPPIKDQASQDYQGEPVNSADVYGCDIRLVLGESSDGGGSGTGKDPIIKAKWEMNALRDNTAYLGSDDNEQAGSQFMPSGQFEVDKKYAICAIATDSHGLADINAVYADTHYPADISTGPNHEPDRLGCGQGMREISLNKLPKMEGIELFCNRIRANNNNLPVFNISPAVYNYDEICRLDGELWKETAAVYCGESALSYEDPSGEYETSVYAADNAGISSAILKNKFAYLPLASFEIDFTNINYGNVKLNTQKFFVGNLAFQENDGKPSIRNTGNTRLNIVVLQDDMGLGKNGLTWNVKYGARIGSDAIFEIYYPEASTVLSNSLNLSETDEMDFTVEVLKFKIDATNYNGQMTLSAISAPHLPCQ